MSCNTIKLLCGFIAVGTAVGTSVGLVVGASTGNMYGYPPYINEPYICTGDFFICPCEMCTTKRNTVYNGVKYGALGGSIAGLGILFKAYFTPWHLPRQSF